MEFVSHSVQETATFAEQWLEKIAEQNSLHQADSQSGNAEGGASLFGLSGHLGAGKTAFVKALAKVLGIREEITSPTFVIMKIYNINNEKQWPWDKLIHIDAYRLENMRELEALDFEKIMSDKSNLVLVEWPEQVTLEKFGEAGRLSFSMRDGVCTIVI